MGSPEIPPRLSAERAEGPSERHFVQVGPLRLLRHVVIFCVAGDCCHCHFPFLSFRDRRLCQSVIHHSLVSGLRQCLFCIFLHVFS
jgi:hypothetical protein